MKLKIDEIKIGTRIRRRLGHLDSLAESMRTLGQLQPVVVTPFNTLIAGQRRIEAAKRLGWTEIEAVSVANLEDAASKLKAERDENTERLELNPVEMVAVGKELDALEKPEAEKRKLGALNKGTSRGGKFPSREKGKVKDIIGNAVGVSGKTYAKAEKVVDAAAENPALQPVVDRMAETGNVDRAYKAVRQQQPNAPTMERHGCHKAVAFWLESHRYRHLIHRHDGTFMAADVSENKQMQADTLPLLADALLNWPEGAEVMPPSKWVSVEA